MVNFKKVDEYITHIENGTLPEGMTFNQFAMDFYNESKVIPMSKYLRNSGRTSKMPKIMNTKKTGEILVDTEKNGDSIKTFLKRKGFSEIPELNYTVVMLVRKVELLDNWKKIVAYLSSDKTIEEINSSTRCRLLPGEVEKLENFIIDELNINEEELNWLLSKFSKINSDKELSKALKKLIRQ
ncbi:hypothetical protein [Fusobacterium sp.]|uniref:hypothetical protein n=1 Tax=Fusobacterium sp. TaxID=68766 RepID=UPI00396C6F09